jgi:hypothetical protein
MWRLSGVGMVAALALIVFTTPAAARECDATWS